LAPIGVIIIATGLGITTRHAGRIIRRPGRARDVRQAMAIRRTAAITRGRLRPIAAGDDRRVRLLAEGVVDRPGRRKAVAVIHRVRAQEAVALPDHHRGRAREVVVHPGRRRVTARVEADRLDRRPARAQEEADRLDRRARELEEVVRLDHHRARVLVAVVHPDRRQAREAAVADLKVAAGEVTTAEEKGMVARLNSSTEQRH
jgi:hypothetical protein